jgi:hypothetical protein
VDLTINNQCSNIELISLVYFTKDTNCRIKFPQQVNSKSIVKVNFTTGIDRDTFGGALLYRLQGKENISAQLLVIWEWNSYKLCSHAWLIEHDITVTWNENKLKEFYDVYMKRNAIASTGRWLLNDNTMLRTSCVSSHGGFEMEVIISEEISQYYQLTAPLWFDPNR